MFRNTNSKLLFSANRLLLLLVVVIYLLSRVWLLQHPPWTVSLQAPLCTELSRQEYWTGLPFPSPEGLPNPGIDPMVLLHCGPILYPLSHQGSSILTHSSSSSRMHWRRKWQPTTVFLPWESQGWGNLVGCCLWGRTESDTTEST